MRSQASEIKKKVSSGQKGEVRKGSGGVASSTKFSPDWVLGDGGGWSTHHIMREENLRSVRGRGRKKETRPAEIKGENVGEGKTKLSFGTKMHSQLHVEGKDLSAAEAEEGGENAEWA